MIIMNAFDRKKEHILQEIGINSENNPDASPKGTIDTLCLPLIFLINSHKDMVTTSSCSGRVSVFLEGSKDKKATQKVEEESKILKIGAKGEGGRWLFVSHEKSDIHEWWSHEDVALQFGGNINMEDCNEGTRYILFKYEPLILHVQCRDFESASRLYSVAMGCGFRESGIGANNNVAIRISIRLDIPIGYLNDSDEIVSLVDKTYLSLITKLAYDRFLVNEEKMKKLYNHINEDIINYQVAQKVVETKEERKQRKMQEGLAKRDEVRKLKEEKRKLKQLEIENGNK